MHNNYKVQTFLSNHHHATELCKTFPQIDNIFSGLLELKTSKDCGGLIKTDSLIGC